MSNPLSKGSIVGSHISPAFFNNANVPGSEPLASGAQLPPVVSGGIPYIRYPNLHVDDLARIALDPHFLPPFQEGNSSDTEEPISIRLRYAALPLDYWTQNTTLLTYQNFHRLGKMRIMFELMEWFSQHKISMTDRLLQDSINLFSSNIFRPFPSRLPESYGNILPDPVTLCALELDKHTQIPHKYDDLAVMQYTYNELCNNYEHVPLHENNRQTVASEDEIQANDPAWPFLRLVYDFFLRFIIGEIETKLLKRYITPSFVSQLLDLFQSQDIHEREALKTLLHRIYAKFMTLRGYIRRVMTHQLHIFIYETEVLHGISELLEILGSIINGFAQPLKPEHCQFFKYVLTPMHKVRTFPSFSPHLTYCVCQFIHKDPSLATTFVLSLLQYWPISHPQKETMYIEELYEILEHLKPEIVKPLLDKILFTVANSLKSLHTQVAGKALQLLTANFLYPHVITTPDLFSMVYPSLLISAEHWNEAIQEQFRLNINRLPETLVDQDITHALNENKKSINEKKLLRQKRRLQWNAIAQDVQGITSKYPNHIIQPIPDHLLPPY